MTSQSLPRLCVTMLLVVLAHGALAGEKILFSTGKGKDSKKTNLAVEQAKPTMQTLDFTKMGGRGSKAEEMAPVMRPPELSEKELDEIERVEKKKKKEDREWMTPEERAANTDPETAREEEYEKLTGREEIKPKLRDDKKTKDAENRRDRDNQSQILKQNQDNLFLRNAKQDSSSPFASSNTSTNRILFGSSSRRGEEQPFRSEQAPGSPVREWGQAAALSDNSRAATLEKLGIGSRPAGQADTGFKPNTSLPAGVATLGSSAAPTRPNANSQLDPLGRSAAGRLDGPAGMPVSGPALRPSLLTDPAALNMGSQLSQPKSFDPQDPMTVRKPAVLPVPQRKF